MRLQDLLYQVNILKIVGNINIDIDDINLTQERLSKEDFLLR